MLIIPHFSFFSSPIEKKFLNFLLRKRRRLPRLTAGQREGSIFASPAESKF
jgi:hypothetical protein